MDDSTIREEILNYIGKAESVLDVGCGDGSLVRFLAHNLASEALGIDTATAEFHIKVEGSRARHGHDARCVKEDAHSMGSFPDNRFDAVVSVRTLHELSRPTAALVEMRRVLKNGGTLFIADFAKGHEGEKIWGEKYYTPEEIKVMLSKSGFKNIRVKEIGQEQFIFATGVSEW